VRGGGEESWGLREKRLMVKERFYNGVTLEQIHGEGFEKGNTTRDGRSEILGIQGSCCLSLCSLEHFISIHLSSAFRERVIKEVKLTTKQQWRNRVSWAEESS